MKTLLILVIFTVSLSKTKNCNDEITGTCSSERQIRYLFYDINPPEGFNLRRDVYLRISILAVQLQKFGNWVLVLPPWPHLYHWRSPFAQERLPWSMFFDIASMQKFAPVIELMDFIDMKSDGRIDQVYVLQHFEEMFKTGKFKDKLEIRECNDPLVYRRDFNHRVLGPFWGFNEFTASSVDCLSFHGHATMLAPFLQKSSHNTVMLDHAEVALHDRFGDSVYWRARRSMRFAKQLRDTAAKYRKLHLNSSDEMDNTLISDDWTLQKPYRRAIGGPYICAHLRRRDFVVARNNDVPSLMFASKQILRALKELKLNVVFIATDAPQHEKDELDHIFRANGVQMETFSVTDKELAMLKDGGVAIIEQIICSYARKFFGTHESTFSFRIQEEREILGFPPEMTFNRLCGDEEKKCEQPSKWLIEY